MLLGREFDRQGLCSSCFVWTVIRCPVSRDRGRGGLLESESEDSPPRLGKSQLGPTLLFLRCIECSGYLDVKKEQENSRLK